MKNKSSIAFDGPVAYLPGGNASVFFSQTSALAGTFATNSARGTAPQIKKIQSAFQVAQWGEDNRFPQNIERLMSYCGIGKAGLDWKARALMGGGILPGTVDGIDDKGEEIFKPLDYQKNRQVYNFIRSREFNRFLLEYTQDWVWFGNCFPELVLDNECKKITNIVHQESCDARFKQMNDSGIIESVYLSKIWGLASDQFAKFDPKKKPKNLIENPENLTEAESKYVATLDCIDMYDALESAKGIAEKLKSGSKKVKSAILPVNYPSVNKTYYQVPAWDGARLAGWVEIACKIPSLLKSMYSKAFNIKYHIEIPESYFPKKFGPETWDTMKDEERKSAKKNLLEEMNEFLSGDENAYKTFVSFFDVTPHTNVEHSRIKITPIESKNNIDKELLTSSAAELQILISMQVNPTIFGAGTVGTGSQRSGGSDIRESFLVHSALLAHERQIMLEPLYLVRDFNEWGDDIVFRFRDTVLTTLDTGAGSKKVVS